MRNLDRLIKKVLREEISQLILSTEGTAEELMKSSQLLSLVAITDFKADVEIFLSPTKKIFFTKNC